MKNEEKITCKKHNNHHHPFIYQDNTIPPVYSSATLSTTSTPPFPVFFPPNFNILSLFLTLPTREPILSVLPIVRALPSVPTRFSVPVPVPFVVVCARLLFSPVPIHSPVAADSTSECMRASLARDCSLPASERPRVRVRDVVVMMVLVPLGLLSLEDSVGWRLRKERAREWVPREWEGVCLPVVTVTAGDIGVAVTEVMVDECGKCGEATRSRSCIWTAQEGEGVDERVCCCGKAKDASSGPNVSSKSRGYKLVYYFSND
jgi:hypothetical protein